MMENNILLSVQDLKVYFRGDELVARALEGVSYEVGRGETVCLVGESGCGKTVSALAILGIIPQPPGEIHGGIFSLMAWVQPGISRATRLCRQ